MPACPHCSRSNPAHALFCYHDGSPLGAAVVEDLLRRRFAAPFIFPSGHACWTFDELTLGCVREWPVAVDLLRAGALAAFLDGLGRGDLAAACREAARFPDGDRALDRFLIDLPARSLQPARLGLAPLEIDLGRLRVGQDVRRDLYVVNDGMALLHGTLSSETPWLVVGDGPGFSSKLFSCRHETTLCVQVRGRALRAGLQPQRGRLVIRSSGGTATVAVKAEVPPQTFAAGVLAGARTPRQLAEKARLNPREAARHFENGAVARWYHDNGWTYPVEGEAAVGLAAVQQFFDALGLATAPKMELSPPSLSLSGRTGESLLATVQLGTSEKRPVYARAVSDQPWLVVSGVDLDGSTAHVHLSIPCIPDRPGETLQANLTIASNGRQRFLVGVRLRVAAVRRAAATALVTTRSPRREGIQTTIDWLPLSAAEAAVLAPGVAEAFSNGKQPTKEIRISKQCLADTKPEAPLRSLPAAPAHQHVPALAAQAPEQPPSARRRGLAVFLLPVGLLLLAGLTGLIAASCLAPAKTTQDSEEPVLPQRKKKCRPRGEVPGKEALGQPDGLSPVVVPTLDTPTAARKQEKKDRSEY